MFRGPKDSGIWSGSGLRDRGRPAEIGGFVAFLDVLLPVRLAVWTSERKPNGKERGKRIRRCLETEFQKDIELTPVHLVVQVFVPAPGTPFLAGNLGSGPSVAPRAGAAEMMRRRLTAASRNWLGLVCDGAAAASRRWRG